MEETPRYPIRTATPDTVRAFLEPLVTAFGEGLTDAEFDDWRHNIEPERLVAAFDGDAAVATAAAFTFRLTVPGGEVAAAGVTAVGVEPGHRRQGILRSLMRQQLDDVRTRGEPVAVLWASESAIYQRFGYGLGTLSGSFEIERGRTAWLRPRVPEGRVRLVDAAEALATFPPVYERMRAVTPGALSRTEDWWRWGILHDAEHMRQGAGPKLRYLFEVDGTAEGYALYRVKTDWDDRGPKGQLLVVEAMALTPRAERAVWSFLFGVDLMRTTKAGRVPVPHPLQLALADPRALGLTAGDGLWVRLVDLPAALAARRCGAAGTLVLEVADAFCPWNAGRWRVTAAGEPGAAVASVERTDAPADLALDVADLAAAYLGAFRLSDLARAGRVAELASGALRRADALLAAERAPWCATMF
ncbi:MAG TPA: GNAT family N-acetyltransferase [Candidatus Nanopelagicales bacterium]|nr:GNAT family N-acetyltransferase [Candidatus Nanopelagicales bacterium]